MVTADKVRPRQNIAENHLQGRKKTFLNLCLYAVELSAQNSFGQLECDLRNVLAACLQDDPLLRPTAGSLLKWTTQNGFAKQTVVELLLHRLESHANTLEREVALRTQDLLEETKKADDLLNEMLPKYDRRFGSL